MSRDELVRGFIGGQMSRRVFLRRLVATGVSIGAAVAYAEILTATPANAFNPATDYYLQVHDFAFIPQTVTFDFLAENAYWGFSSPGGFLHTATDTSGLGQFDALASSAYGEAYWSGTKVAGSYPYHCKETNHIAMTGTIRIPMMTSPTSGGIHTVFDINWSTGSSIPNGRVADVQRRKPGETWKTWKKGTTTRGSSWTPSAKGKWLFRTRLRDPISGEASGWSPKLSIPVG